MTNETEFSRQIEATEQRLQDLLRRLDQADVDERALLVTATQELSNSLEELHVAHEELHQQNEELLAAREQLDAERERYRELFAFAPDGYLVTDAAGIIQEANRTAVQLLGVEEQYLHGKPLGVFLAEGERTEFYARINRLRAKGTSPLGPWETTLQPGDGASFPAAVTVAAFHDRDDKLTGMRWLMRDITARKKVEAEREQLINELDAFAHTVAHDLKRPLTLVVGYASILTEDFDTIPPEELKQHLRAIAASGHQMNNIVEELLLLAGVRRKKEVKMIPLNMASIIEEVKFRLAFLIEKSEAEVVLPESWPLAMGHGPWVEEVWVNYISNAMQYGGEPPRVELGGERLSNDKVRFWVQDNGQGLSEEEQSNLFTPFIRLHQVEVEGHGLGLSIVRRIVERLDGEVGVESEGSQGSTFWFTLSAAPRLT
jgi:PAS domain S-box-containing protein